MSSSKRDENLVNFFKEKERETTGISSYLESFITEFNSHSTRRAYKNDLKSFFSFLKLGNVHIQHPRDIKDYHYKTYRDRMLKESKTTATVSRRLVAIRAFLKHALSQKWIEINPVEHIKLPKVQTQSPTQAFQDKEALQMIEAPDVLNFTGNVQRLAFTLLFYLGLRRDELVSIRRRDLRQDRRNAVLTIYGKGSKTRYLPIRPSIGKEIEDYLDRLKGFQVHLGPDDFLLQTSSKKKNTGPIDGSTIYRWVKKFTQKLGIRRNLSPHSCRATAISHLLDTRQVPIRDVAIFAGHENVNTTERYDKRRENLDKNAAYDVDYQAEEKNLNMSSTKSEEQG